MRTFTTMLLLLPAVVVFSQSEIINPTDTTEQFTLCAKTIIVNHDQGIMMLEDNVKAEMGKRLTVEADSARYDKSERMLITYGTRNVQFDDLINVSKEDNDTFRFYFPPKWQ